ncbi:uncharacterized protein LOC143289551 [Babylonia areolata]|uniref:uncharacterized protein LOC143289551 n=1 Tax=Babylonia areolata TaxID=304850 RepID=UPI003FD453D0
MTTHSTYLLLPTLTSTTMIIMITATIILTTTVAAAAEKSKPSDDASEDPIKKGDNVTELRERLERVRLQVEWLTKDNQELERKNQMLVRALQEEEHARNSAVMTIQNLLKDVNDLRERLEQREEEAEKVCKDGVCSSRDEL